MANYVTLTANEIIAAIKGQSIKLRDKLTFKTVLTAIDFNDDDVVNKRAVAAMVAGSYNQITQNIPVNSDGFYDYNYDGSLGSNPTMYVQLRVADPSVGWVSYTGIQPKILDNGHIYTEGDFSADSYRLVIKP